MIKIYININKIIEKTFNVMIVWVKAYAIHVFDVCIGFMADFQGINFWFSGCPKKGERYQ